jgi:hypothetical protein
VRYTTCRKLAPLAAAKLLQGEGRSLQSAADKLRVSIANLSRWGGCVFLASCYEWVTVMHEIPISSAQKKTSLPYPRTQ